MPGPRWARLRASLVDNGWVWRDNSLVAPNATMWFTTRADDPDVAEFRDRMTLARDAIEAGGEAGGAAGGEAGDDPGGVDHAALQADLISLVAALDELLVN